MTSERLAEIRVRAEAATQGPWGHHPVPKGRGQRVTNKDGATLFVNERPGQMRARVDATFIAAARTDVPELVAEIERLAAQSVWPVDERTEIRHGWLVESGYPGDFIGGYGMVPDSDAMPLVCLDTIPGYPDLATAEAEANRLRADLRTLAQQVEKVRALHQPWDDGPQPYCTHDREPWPCPTEQALGAR